MEISFPRWVWYLMALLDIALAFMFNDWTSYVMLFVAAACVTAAITGAEDE